MRLVMSWYGHSTGHRRAAKCRKYKSHRVYHRGISNTAWRRAEQAHIMFTNVQITPHMQEEIKRKLKSQSLQDLPLYTPKEARKHSISPYETTDKMLDASKKFESVVSHYPGVLGAIEKANPRLVVVSSREKPTTVEDYKEREEYLQKHKSARLPDVSQGQAELDDSRIMWIYAPYSGMIEDKYEWNPKGVADTIYEETEHIKQRDKKAVRLRMIRDETRKQQGLIRYEDLAYEIEAKHTAKQKLQEYPKRTYWKQLRELKKPLSPEKKAQLVKLTFDRKRK